MALLLPPVLHQPLPQVAAAGLRQAAVLLPTLLTQSPPP